MSLGSEPHHAIERQLAFGNLLEHFDRDRQLHDAGHRKPFVPSNFERGARFQVNQRDADSSRVLCSVIRLNVVSSGERSGFLRSRRRVEEEDEGERQPEAQ